MFGTEAFEETVASDEVEKQLQQQLQHAGSMQQPCTNDAAPSAACPCHGTFKTRVPSLTCNIRVLFGL